MSDDLISRQAAIFAILECCDSDFADEYECGYDDGLRKAVHKLKHFPSAQPERKKGKWIAVKIGNGDTRYTCSECGKSFDCDSRETLGFTFCPKCGMEATP